VSGSKRLRLAGTRQGRLKRLRIYNRYLRTSEAIGNYHAGTGARPGVRCGLDLQIKDL